jgi:hypothetical protein
MLKPTAGDLKALDALGIDRSKYTNPVARYPAKATTTLNSLLGGGLKKRQKAWITRQLKRAQDKGATSDPGLTPVRPAKLSNDVNAAHRSIDRFDAAKRVAAMSARAAALGRD